jgi:hypothetical protein
LRASAPAVCHLFRPYFVEATMSGGELWFVKLPNGDVHHVTVDQLDTAFEAGHIDANTLVLAEGSSQWTRLGEAAGLDEPPAAMPSPTPAPVVRPVSVAPVASRPPVAYASYAPPAGSIRPVAFDLGSDLDLDDVPFKKSGGRKGWAFAALTLALVGGGVGFAATHGIALGGGGSSNIAAAAAIPMPVPVAPPTPVAAPVPAPAPQAPPALAGALPSMESGLNPRFTDAQKEKLLQADKARDDQSKSRQASQHTSHPRYKSSSTFTKGGNKYDPLNSDL